VLVVWGSGATVLSVSGLPHPTRSAGTPDEALGSTAVSGNRGGRRASGSPHSPGYALRICSGNLGLGRPCSSAHPTLGTAANAASDRP
jgi:hypothetical protein